MGRMAGGVRACLWGVGVAGLVALARDAGAQVPSPDGVLGVPESREARAAPKATPGRTKLVYAVGAGLRECDDEGPFRTWIASDVGKDPFVSEGPALFTVRAALAREGAAIRGTYTLEDAEGHRLLERKIVHRTCTQVIDWMALDIALTVFLSDPDCENACTRALRDRLDELSDAQRRDRERERDEHDELSELRAGLERERQERIAAQKALQRALERRRFGPMDLTYALSTGVLITANLTPNVGPGVWLGGELRAGPLSMGMELRAVLPSRVEYGPNNDTDLSHYVALLVPCGRYSYFFGCAVAGGGFNMDYDANGIGPKALFGGMWQLGGRIGAEVPFAENRFAARAWGEVLGTTPQLSIGLVEDGVDIYRWHRPDVSAFFGLGLVVKFGDEETR